MSNFLEALNTKVSDIARPALLPTGTYIWKISKPHRESTSNDGKWASVEFPCVPVAVYEPAEDVDQDEISAYGDLKAGANSIRFMLDLQADGPVAMQKFQWNLRRFLLDTLKVEGDDDSTLKELLAKAIGAEFVAQAAHRHVAERDEWFCDVRNFAPTE